MGALGEGGGEHLHLPGRDQVVEERDPSGGALRVQWGPTPQLTLLSALGAPPGTRREQFPSYRRALHTGGLANELSGRLTAFVPTVPT